MFLWTKHNFTVLAIISSVTVGLVFLPWTTLPSTGYLCLNSTHRQQDSIGAGRNVTVQPSSVYLRLNSTHRQQDIIAAGRNVTGSNVALKYVSNSERKLVTFDPMQKYVTTLAKRYKSNTSQATISRHLRQNDMKYQLKNWTSDGFLFVRVMERYKDVLSAGGSNIHGTSISHLDGADGDDRPGKSPEEDHKSSVLSLCAYEDYFNGTYLVQCPLYSSNVDVDLHLTIVDFTFNFGPIIPAKPKKVPLYSDNVRFQSIDLPKAQKPMNCWLRTRSDTWYWYDETSKLMDLSLDKYCKAAASFDRLYLIGASNMRYQFSYLLKMCAEKVPDIRKRAIYVFACYGLDVIGQLKDMVESYSRKNCEGDGTPPIRSTLGKCLPDGMIADGKPLQVYTYAGKTRDMYKKTFFGNSKCWLSTAKKELKLDFCRPSKNRKIGIMIITGPWDVVEKNNNKEFTDKFQHLFDQVLHNVSQTFGDSQNVRFLVMSPPVTAFSPQRILFGEVLRNISEAHGVYYFPFAGMVLPRYSEQVDRAHYLTCKWLGETDIQCKGNVGTQVARAAIIALEEQN